MEAVNTGSAIKMPVGDQIKGRLLNVIGDPIDGIGEVNKTGVMKFMQLLPNLKTFLLKPKSYLQELK